MTSSRIALLVFATSAWASVAQAFPWPGRVRGRVTGVVGEQRSYVGGREIRFHNSVDLGFPYYAQVGKEVFSVHSGYCQRDGGYAVRITETPHPDSPQLSAYVHIRDRCETGDRISGLLAEPALQATKIGEIEQGPFGLNGYQSF